jgi:hypothetical protein
MDSMPFSPFLRLCAFLVGGWLSRMDMLCSSGMGFFGLLLLFLLSTTQNPDLCVDEWGVFCAYHFDVSVSTPVASTCSKIQNRSHRIIVLWMGSILTFRSVSLNKVPVKE